MQCTAFKGWCLAASWLYLTKALSHASHKADYPSVPLQLSSFRLCDFKVGPESFAGILQFLFPQYWTLTIWSSDIHKCIALSPDNDPFTNPSRAWSESFENFNLNIHKWADLNTGSICECGIWNGYFCSSWHFTTLSGVIFHVQCKGWESASDD